MLEGADKCPVPLRECAIAFGIYVIYKVVSYLRTPAAADAEK